MQEEMMKRLLTGLMLLLAATAASAEWTQIDSGDAITTYIDKATIRRNGNFVKMWELIDNKSTRTVDGDSYLSSKGQREYDCKEEQVRHVAFTWFSGQMANGKVVYLSADPGKWQPVSPGSVAELLWKAACGK